MKFRTEVKIGKQDKDIQHSHRIMTIGSCFANHLYSFLEKGGFHTVHNPFGILFNPLSISKNIHNALDQHENEKLFVERDGLHFHYDFHSSVFGSNKKELLEKIQKIQKQFVKNIKETDFLVITFGTTWVYKELNAQEIVANCHKIPQFHFQKIGLKLEQLKSIFIDLFKRLLEFNPGLNIVLTVSPVRHFKNGLHENNISKSTLLLLTDYLEKSFQEISYFPSYELVLDDLRDYRFFEQDLIHPNAQAVDYVMEKFSASYFNEKTAKIVQLSNKLVQLNAHKFLHPNEENFRKKQHKLANLRAEIERLKA